MKKKKIAIGIICAVVAWVVIGVIDFTMVNSFHKPVFCVGAELADDGGSGTYVGLGYSFDIEGNFMPEAENPGVTSYRGYILGIEVIRGFREEMLSGIDSESLGVTEEIEAVPNNAHTLEVTENSVGEIGRETFSLSVEISEDDAHTLTEIMNNGTWKEAPTDCESDCVINLKGHWTHYNSESGILNKYNLKDMSVYSSKVQEVNGKSLVLSEEDRITVNAILEKYITLETEST